MRHSLFKGVTQDIKRRAVNGDSEVIASALRSNQEVEDLFAANPYQNREALRIKNISMGHIRGLRLFSENVFEAVASNLSSPLDELISLVDPQTLPVKKLIEWDFWLRSLDEKIINATSLVKDGEQFLTLENFKLISLLPSSPEVKERVANLTLLTLDSVGPTSIVDSQQVPQTSKKLNRKERRRQKFGENNKGWD